MDKLVSIVVPIYKVEKYLERCINSICKQTYRNLEIILVNDGSPDNCPKMCDAFAKQDNRITVIHKENGGLSSARNAGIEKAAGEYISFVDSDDWIHEKFIETLLMLCEENDCEISQCDFLFVNNDSIDLPLSHNAELRIFSNEEAVEKCCAGPEAIKYNVAWNKIYLKKLFEDIRYPEGKIHEDEFVTYKLMWKARRIAVTNLYLYNYLQRADSIIGSGFSIRRLDRLQAYRERERILQEIKLEKAYIKMAVRHYYEIWNCYDKLVKEVEGSENIQKELLEEAEILNNIILSLPGRTPSDNIRVVYRYLPEFQKKKIRETYGTLFDPHKNQEEFIFPFQKIRKGATIAIYAAGNVGKTYYRQILSTGYCDITLWADQKWPECRRSGYPVDSVDQLLCREYDHVLIAVKDIEAASNIKNDMLAWGIREEKIIWHNPDVLSVEEGRIKQFFGKRTERLQQSSCKRIFLMNTPIHGNLGDHAITLASKESLKDYFTDTEIVEVSSLQWDYFYEQIGSSVTPKDVIFIVGGGFMGDLWPNEAMRVKRIISSFPDNQIVFLPQTFYYSDKDDDSMLEKDITFYNEYKNVLFIHRDIFSYRFFSENIVKDKSRNMHFPDMVLYLCRDYKEEDRSGVLFCMRSDKEKVLQESALNDLQKLIHEKGISYRKTDTVVSGKIISDEREEVEKKLDEFGHTKLVVTDRLHGMLFAAVTGTPCIAVNNISKKVEGVYRWIQEIPYIKCTEYLQADEKMIDELLCLKGCEYDREKLQSAFGEMMKAIENWIHN